MVSSSFWLGVEQVLNLLKEYSEKHKPVKHASTKLERLSGWATMVGGLIFAAAEVLRRIGNIQTAAYVLLSTLGFVIFLTAAVVNIVEFVRSTRPPFLEHIDRTLAAATREHGLFEALERFETVILELACRRLQLESTKVASRLAVVGGGEGLRTSMVGVVILAASLISQYEPIVHGWTIKSVALLGVALLVGLSIGGLLARYGASEADYYSEIIRMVLLRKEYMAKNRHVPFSCRVAAKRRGA